MTIHGVLLLDKPLGLSSNVAVQRVRRLFDRAKAGHTGTLDPLASGLLPVCLGEATKFSHTLLDADKAYEAVIRFGFVSSTGDAEGEVSRFGDPAFSTEDLRRVVLAFTGPISQLPPMHSALKKDGKPLYEYARAGQEVERQPRNIIIKALEVYDIKNEYAYVRVLCTKGTYVRVLAQDIGQALGCGGYLSGLRRTDVGGMSVSDAISLEALEALDAVGRWKRLLPLDCLLTGLPAVYLEPDAARRIRNGLEVEGDAGTHIGSVRLYESSGTFLGIGARGAEGRITPKRMLSTGVQL